MVETLDVDFLSFSRRGVLQSWQDEKSKKMQKEQRKLNRPRAEDDVGSAQESKAAAKQAKRQSKSKRMNKNKKQERQTG